VDEKWLKNEEKGWTEWWGLSKSDLVGRTTDYNVSRIQVSRLKMAYAERI
jgi:hypothetical protein